MTACGPAFYFQGDYIVQVAVANRPYVGGPVLDSDHASSLGLLATASPKASPPTAPG